MEENNCETKEDYIELLCEQYSDGLEWYKSNFGDEGLMEVIKNYCSLDTKAIAEECRNIDGIAHSLASYDGDEAEKKVNGTIYYIYRTN